MKNNPELKTSPAKATADINDRIDKGEQLRTMPINIEINEFFDNLNRDYDSWNKYNGQMLNIMFTTEEISKEYWIDIPTIYRKEPSIGMKIEVLRKKYFEKIGRLKSIQDRLNLFSIATDETQPQEKAPVKPHTHPKDGKVISNQAVSTLEIASGLEKFQQDYPAGKKTAFIVMQFGNTSLHSGIVNCIKKTLEKYDIAALRADDKQYMDDLFPNVKVYMHACDFGIAVFDRITEDDFNPNVTLEVGYMLGLGKNVLLLKDQTLKSLSTDLTGKLYKQFDTTDVLKTMPDQIEKWLSDKGLN